MLDTVCLFPYGKRTHRTVCKNTPITERFQSEFRAKFFNVGNHANRLLTGGGRDFGNPAFGVIQNTLGPRIIQFGLKLRF